MAMSEGRIVRIVRMVRMVKGAGDEPYSEAPHHLHPPSPMPRWAVLLRMGARGSRKTTCGKEPGRAPKRFHPPARRRP